VAWFGRNSNRGYNVCHAFSSSSRRGRWSSPGVPTFQPYSSSSYSTTTALTMKNKKGKTIAKQNLPSKLCVVCERPFTWRKKWEANWDEVTTCSKSCNAKRKQQHKKQEKVQTTATPASSAAVVSVPKNTSGKYDDGSSPFYKTAAVVSSSFPAPKIKDSTSPTTSTVATTNCHEEESSLSVVASAQEGVEDDNICSPNTGTSIVSSDEEEQDGEELVLDPKALKKIVTKTTEGQCESPKTGTAIKAGRQDYAGGGTERM